MIHLKKSEYLEWKARPRPSWLESWYHCFPYISFKKKKVLFVFLHEVHEVQQQLVPQSTAALNHPTPSFNSCSIQFNSSLTSFMHIAFLPPTIQPLQSSTEQSGLLTAKGSFVWILTLFCSAGQACSMKGLENRVLYTLPVELARPTDSTGQSGKEEPTQSMKRQPHTKPKEEPAGECRESTTAGSNYIQCRWDSRRPQRQNMHSGLSWWFYI